jgi:GNAT superfamily N-acetyltransferase
VENHRVRRGRRDDLVGFRSLLTALAEFEKLQPPDDNAMRRMARDIFDRHRLGMFVATVGGKRVGYALYFFTYSSFLGRPTLYLEDLFVTQNFRGKGIGGSLFRRCVKEAISEGCGRMEWAVLTWNRKAIEFYEKLGAKRLSDWYVYRLDSSQFPGIVNLDSTKS